MEYSLLDKLAFNSYIKEIEKNTDDSYICTIFKNDIKGFIEYHNKDKENLSYYYNINKKIVRKIKLDKLNEIKI